MNNIEYKVYGIWIQMPFIHVYDRSKALTQDVNESGKNFQMRKMRCFSLLAHKNLIQYDEEW